MPMIRYTACLFLVGISLFLQACSFQPLYRERKTLPLRINTIAEPEGQILRNALMTKFQNASQDSDILDITLSFDDRKHSLRHDGTIREKTLLATCHVKIKDAVTGTIKFDKKFMRDTSMHLGSEASLSSLPMIISEKEAKKSVILGLAKDIHGFIMASYLH